MINNEQISSYLTLLLVLTYKNHSSKVRRVRAHKIDRMTAKIRCSFVRLWLLRKSVKSFMRKKQLWLQRYGTLSKTTNLKFTSSWEKNTLTNSMNSIRRERRSTKRRKARKRRSELLRITHASCYTLSVGPWTIQSSIIKLCTMKTITIDLRNFWTSKKKQSN
jgi:hypothetical protein